MTKTKGTAGVTFACLAAAVLVLAALVHEAAAVTCDPMQLSPCLDAITGGGPPSAECCNRVKEQVPCLCDYLKNPIFKPYIPGAKRILAACKIAAPKCD
ncbi:Bifunctional inhibitor/lipid-transfer protein/seed storage 2S albumin superfamily protein [Striga hermonthica]|uniref:Bifunctional inhibitor/lipid-transfer protein/seed storage 2S albumin superfamily protein n=1 Tax=Striga hermonthica TaxID=68872 RepID=A0A9N7RTT3_STRHE|nr:Bifunctional inhibitor/lipid-transfer protein/seed storage 2S albumin superfamily protein [Striga hermonthica]